MLVSAVQQSESAMCVCIYIYPSPSSCASHCIPTPIPSRSSQSSCLKYRSDSYLVRLLVRLVWLVGLGNSGKVSSEQRTGLRHEAQIPRLCSQTTKQMAAWNPKKSLVGQGHSGSCESHCHSREAPQVMALRHHQAFSPSTLHHHSWLWAGA